MKRFGFLLIAALMCACVTLPASAESNYALFLQYYDGSDTESSWGGGLKADWLMGDSAWGIEARATYMGDLGFDTGQLGATYGNLDIMAMPLDVGLNYHFMENRNIWLGAGVSWILTDINNGTIDNLWGWYATLGYQTGEPGAPWAFFSELVYRQAEGTVDGAWDLDTFDANLNGIGVNVGVAYRF